MRREQTEIMKLRIKDNSIRLRLSQSEVASIREQGLLRAHVSFSGGARFEYALESSPAVVAPVAEYSDNVLLVKLPESTVLQWADSDQIAITSNQMVGNDDELLLLVEKDFACLTPRDGENESDMFPHPEADERSC